MPITPILKTRNHSNSSKGQTLHMAEIDDKANQLALKDDLSPITGLQKAGSIKTEPLTAPPVLN